MSTNAATHGPVWHHFDSSEHERESNALGMWVFLATEFMLFGALFTAYIVFRWLYPESFAAASRRLNLFIGGLNTVVLLTSSLTMVLAVRAGRAGEHRTLVQSLITTAFLGTVFLALKATEYAIDYREQLVPGLAFDATEWGSPARSGPVQLFLVLYYVMTGLHAVHLSVGIVVMLVLATRATRGAFKDGHYGPIEAWGLYWHFVDIVWLFLLPLLYLVGTRMAG